MLWFSIMNGATILLGTLPCFPCCSCSVVHRLRDDQVVTGPTRLRLAAFINQDRPCRPSSITGVQRERGSLAGLAKAMFTLPLCQNHDLLSLQGSLRLVVRRGRARWGFQLRSFGTAIQSTQEGGVVAAY